MNSMNYEHEPAKCTCDVCVHILRNVLKYNVYIWNTELQQSLYVDEYCLSHDVVTIKGKNHPKPPIVSLH